MQRVLFLTILFINMIISAQTFNHDFNFLWPIKGSKPGENIILSPSDPIYDNRKEEYKAFGNYLIGAEEDSPVISISDGVIVDISYSYLPEFSMIIMSDNYEELYEEIVKHNQEDIKWLSLSISIEIKPGHIIVYSGLKVTSANLHKTGDTLRKGDIIGIVGYCYRQIDQSSLELSYLIHSLNADLGPDLLGINNHLDNIGLISESKNYKTFSHSIEDLKKALDILIISLKEGHPSLYEYSTKEEIENEFQKVESLLIKPMTSDQFYKLLMPIIHTIRDNHTNIDRIYAHDPENTALLYEPHVFFPIDVNVKEGKCYIKKDPVFDKKPGSEIIEINGENVKNIIEQVALYITVGDGENETWNKQLLGYRFDTMYLLEKEFSAGDEICIKFMDNTEEIYQLSTDMPEFMKSIKYDKSSYQINKISEDIIQLKIKHMRFTEIEKEELANFFIQNDLKNKTIILDLRDNTGGNPEDTYFVYSFFSENSFYPEKERKVNSNGPYSFFRFTENYISTSSNYKNYNKKENREGFFLTIDDNPEFFRTIEPIHKGHFSGPVYILTNGKTASAATELTAYFRNFDRGIIVGEEGAGNYYRSTGIDFAKVNLGTTGLMLTIPLVQSINNFVQNDRNPKTRGVIPDFIISETIDDVISGSDSVLIYSVELINKKMTLKRIKIIVFFSSLVLALFLLIIFIFRLKIINFINPKITINHV